MSPQEQAPPEGALIRLARKARGLSVGKAIELVRERAPDIRLGVSRWYHIEGGTEGKDKVVTAPEDTLAHMAYVVGITPDRLAEVGRQDAADILEEIIRQERAKTPVRERPDVYMQKLVRLWPQSAEWQRRHIVGVLEQLIKDAPATPPASDIAHDKHRTA